MSSGHGLTLNSMTFEKREIAIGEKNYDYILCTKCLCKSYTVGYCINVKRTTTAVK